MVTTIGVMFVGHPAIGTRTKMGDHPTIALQPRKVHQRSSGHDHRAWAEAGPKAGTTVLMKIANTLKADGPTH
jgi:hypothetical protein